MEVDLDNNTDPSTGSIKAIEAQLENVDEASLTKTPSNVLCSKLFPEMTSAELAPLQPVQQPTPLQPIKAHAPLLPVKTHSVTTVKVTKDSTSVDMDETLSNATYPLYVNSITEAEAVLHRFENDTKTRYSVWRCPKDFGYSQIDITNKRIYWQEFDIGDKITVKSNGVPFIMMGRKVYDCRFGRDRNVRVKERLRLQRVVEESDTKTRKPQPSRKLDCPAKVLFCEIIYFPDFKILYDTKYHRGMVAKEIKKSFAAGSINMRNIERRIYLSFPTEDDHTGHPTCVQSNNNLTQRVDPKISKKISELVSSGVRNEKEMNKQLESYINQVYPGKAKPFHSNRRYFPNTGVVQIKMYHELVLQRLMVLDCDQITQLVTRVQNAQPHDKFHTRSFEGMNEVLAQGAVSVSVEELLEDELRVRQKFSQQQFVFVHQTSFQRHLLKRYGNHVCFLDPVYRTVKYPLPLFFLMVKTNVDYQVVATFVLQDENKESTKEALEFIKAWNPEWKPSVFMVDNDTEEIASVEECFPDCKVLLSYFHREKAWEYWLSQSSNGIAAHKKAILLHLQHFAQAKSEHEFEEALELLKQTEWWKCNYGKTFRVWLKEKWLSIKERWVYAYQKTFLRDMILTNFTVEDQKKDFTHEELLNQNGSLLSDVLNMIFENILPAKRNFYIEQNVPLSNETNIPSFCQVRPRQLTEHTAESMATVNEFTADDVVVNSVARGEFFVKSSDSDLEYKVYFGNDTEPPHCECEDWSKTMMPCKHFLVVMRHFKNWNWSSFPKTYRNSPYFGLHPISDLNSVEEDLIASQTDQSGCQTDPSESSPDPSVSRTHPSGSRPDPSGSRIDPSESRPDPSGSRTDPSGSRPYTNGSRTDPSGSRIDASGSRTDPSGSRPENDGNIFPAVSKVFDERSGSKSTASECRDLLNDINNMTYLMQDKKVLRSLHDVLRETLTNLKLSLVDDDVGPSSEAIKSEGKSNIVYHIKGKKRASDCSNQISTASKLLKVDEHRTSKSEIPKEVLECVDVTNSDPYPTMIGNVDTCGGMNANSRTSGDNGSASEGMNGDVIVRDVGTLTNMSDTNGNIETPEGTNVVMASCNTDNPQESTENPDNPLQLSQSSETSRLNFSELNDDLTMLYSNPAGTLSKHEERLLTRQEEITQTTVNLAQDLLQKAFPQINGLQTVSRGPIQAFKHVSGEFIQILHDGYKHWVCASNVVLDVRDPSTVAVYDSMNQGFIAKFTKQQLASFMCIQSAEMKVIMKSVQQQTSPVDCGVFAIAFATALAFGEDPSKLRFEAPKMRAHLIQCLKLKKMSPFPGCKPGSGNDIVLSKRKFYTVELFCSCRMPYEKPKSEADLMAQCNVCCGWFHQKCDNLKSSGQNFVCGSCLRKV